MKLEIEIDLNDKSKVAAFILFLQACNGVIVTETSVGVSKEVMANAIPETPKKTAKKVEKTAEAVEKIDPAIAPLETKEVETAEGEEDKISLEQIREAFADKVNTGDNRVKLKNELTRLDAPNLVKLDKAHYADFLNFVNAL